MGQDTEHHTGQACHTQHSAWPSARTSRVDTVAATGRRALAEFFSETLRVLVQQSEQMVPSAPSRQKLGVGSAAMGTAAAAAVPVGGWNVLQVRPQAAHSACGVSAVGAGAHLGYVCCCYILADLSMLYGVPDTEIKWDGCSAYMIGLWLRSVHGRRTGWWGQRAPG